jgi:predicted molibdopterin-dependent oxidoreductase YjgC
MFRRLPEGALAGRTVAVTFDGRALVAREGESVAAALLAAGIDDFRTTPVSGAARGPYCLMGACFDCVVVVDGVPNRQACLTPVRDGMRIERQQGARPVSP